MTREHVRTVIALVPPAGQSEPACSAPAAVARLEISVPPDRLDRQPFPLEVSGRTRSDGQGTPEEPALEEVQLLEASEYCFALLDATPGEGPALEPCEVFSFDSDRLRGRLKTGNLTGRMRITVQLGDGRRGEGWVEVRSRKLGYLDHYRWMLRDIAGVAAEAIMERFAPTSQRFRPDSTSDARTLYQRFAFLKARLTDSTLTGALQHLLARPHHRWQTIEVERPAGGQVPGGSQLMRQLQRAGARISTPHLPCPSVPERLATRYHTETLDTPENRFVKHALESWRDMVASLAAALARQAVPPAARAPLHRSPESALEAASLAVAHLDALPPAPGRSPETRATQKLEAPPASGATARGRDEAERLLEHLDELLSHSLFHEVGRLEELPLASQVLQRRSGYRDVLQAWLEVECAAQLSWRGDDASFDSGQRDVAWLYEVWAYLQVAGMLASLCGERRDLSQLLAPSEDGLTLDLARGHESRLTFQVEHQGRSLELELYYNKTFRGQPSPLDASRAEPNSSWTREMRPDISLLIAPQGARDTHEAFWVHLDAKYRIDSIVEMFGHDSPAHRAKRDDLLKMHAYRDAIRRSSGAYVIYPGDATETLVRYHELQPGIGAFPLRPAPDGSAEGADELRRFVHDLLDHAAARTTQHERSRYWLHQVHRQPPDTLLPPLEALPFLEAPPADSTVLLGYVKSAGHLAWIERERRYNLRAASRGSSRRGAVQATSTLLTAQHLLLYGPHTPTRLYRLTGEVETWSRTDLESTGYPGAGGASYHCVAIEDLTPRVGSRARSARQVALLPGALDHDQLAPLVAALDAPLGSPVALSWHKLLVLLSSILASS